jgi:lipopolysaccharide export system permease protein
MRIDMSGFKMDRTDEELFKEDHRMLNLDQLANKTDTLKRINVERANQFYETIQKSYLINDSLSRQQVSDTIQLASFDEVFSTLSKEQKQQAYSIALNAVRTNKGRASAAMIEMGYHQENLLSIQIEWHRKFTFSIACLIMFFIGAPLGAIVKKGGLGMPVVISVVFFLLFWVLSIMGQKSAQEMVLEPYQGMWLATAVLFPLGFSFTYKATTDSAMFNLDSYFAFFKKLFKKKN